MGIAIITMEIIITIKIMYIIIMEIILIIIKIVNKALIEMKTFN